jgi:DNA topoisomerase-2
MAARGPLAAGAANAAAGASSAAGSKTIEQIYQKKTQIEHILLRPDSYVGSVQKITQPMWVLDAPSGRIVHRSVTYVPGLYKIFDEILVNAADNKQRDPGGMTGLQVTIDPVAGCISVWNNGEFDGFLAALLRARGDDGA